MFICMNKKLHRNTNKKINVNLILVIETGFFLFLLTLMNSSYITTLFYFSFNKPDASFICL